MTVLLPSPAPALRPPVEPPCPLELTSLLLALDNPRTPLRRFLDRELSAGPRPARAVFHQHLFDHPAPGPLLLADPAARRERSAVGTAVDLRLRLAFTTAEPLDRATALGIFLSTCSPDERVGSALSRTGAQLAQRLAAVAADWELDARRHPLARNPRDEEHLARLLLAAAWYAVAARAGGAFMATPVYRVATQDPDGFTLQRLLELPAPEVVDDVARQVARAGASELAVRRRQSAPGQCAPGPGFPGQALGADADLVVDGLLVDFKSTTLVRELSQQTLWQLVGYLLLDVEDRLRIDSVGIYFTRRGTLVHWSVPEFLARLGARRRHLPDLRNALAELVAGCEAGREPSGEGEESAVAELLKRLTPELPPGHCPVCAQALSSHSRTRGTGGARTYCSSWCTKRSLVLRQRGVL